MQQTADLTELAELIKQLELKLLHTDMKANPSLVNELLAADFEEISETGHVHARQSVVDWLMNKNSADRWSLTQFKVRYLSTDCVLATYYARRLSEENGATGKTIRSSVWKQYDNHWKMTFHQASPIN